MTILEQESADSDIQFALDEAQVNHEIRRESKQAKLLEQKNAKTLNAATKGLKVRDQSDRLKKYQLNSRDSSQYAATEIPSSLR